jgi:Flp pilus assembly protein TadD
LRKLAGEQPDNPGVLSLLGVAEAGVGDKEAALRDAQRAAELLPVTTDALDGPAYLAAEAEVRARNGDDDGAVHLLQTLIGMPAGRVMSAPRIARDPVFARVRDRVLR